MDENTKEVLLAVISLVSAVVTPLIVIYVASKQNKKISVVEEKLDENHRLTNGHMTKLLETTAKLATATEKARQKEDDKNKKK